MPGGWRVERMAEMWVNMGPQHPSTHGLWDLLVRVDGETIQEAVTKIGYLHRGVEKIAENRTIEKFLPLNDRLCYVANSSWTTLFVMTVEELLEVTPPERAQYIRVVLLELQRIASHLVWLGAYCSDMGLLTMLLWAWRDRELVLDLLQFLTGARIMHNFPRVGGVRNDLPPTFKERALKVMDYLDERTKEYEMICSSSELFRMRTEGIGVLPLEKAKDLGCTGPVLRASGLAQDVRKDDPYLVYERLDFKVPVGKRGDAWDRYTVRLEEIRQSASLVRQALDKMPEGDFIIPNFKMPKALPARAVYRRAEDPRGEGAMYLVGDGKTNRPYRLKIRSPTFVHLLSIPYYIKGAKISDAPVIMGGADPCMAEVDR
ncbi:MAG: NADH-quinone oxidoreductase subunit NuoD [Thermoplasmata archaeon]